MITINGSTGVAGNNGTAGTPTYQGEDTNTGIFFPAADTVAVATAGTERVTVTSVGRVGVGTNSPNQLVHVSGGNVRVSSASENTIVTNGGNFTTGAVTDSAILYGSGSLLFGNGSTERMRIDSSGNVGIGTASPSKKLHLAGTAGSSAILLAKTDSGASTLGQIGFSTVNGTVAGIDATAITDSNNGALRFWTTGGSPQSDVTSLSERARIDTSGNLLVGTTSDIGGLGGRLQIASGGSRGIVQSTNSNIRMQEYLVSSTTVGFISNNGTSTTYATSSDHRLKENVQPMQDALAVIAQLNPVTYTWKDDGSDGQGFIAHELQAVVPDCVTGEKDAVDETGNPQYQGVDTSFLVATLVAAIKELKAEVDSLKAQLEAQ